MLIFSKLGQKGNLGNQLFQIASTIGIAKKNNLNYGFPEWKSSEYFDKNHNIVKDYIDFEPLYEKNYQYSEYILENNNYDLNGWFQSEKYFDIKLTKDFFKFKSDFFETLIQKNAILFSKKNILVSVRRGDFVNHPYYFQTSFRYYLLAIIYNFPDWKNRNLIFASDDIPYCKFHFSFLENAFFLENSTAIEQLALATKCDDFIISNSTFSWWMAWLGEKKYSKIIRPVKNFRDEFAKNNDDSDFFPKRWIIFDDSKFKLPNQYFFLKLKGFVYQLFVDLKYNYLIHLKFFKNFVKKIIRW